MLEQSGGCRRHQHSQSTRCILIHDLTLYSPKKYLSFQLHFMPHGHHLITKLEFSVSILCQFSTNFSQIIVQSNDSKAKVDHVSLYFGQHWNRKCIAKDEKMHKMESAAAIQVASQPPTISGLKCSYTSTYLQCEFFNENFYFLGNNVVAKPPNCRRKIIS